MFVGHFALGFAAKRVTPRLPLPLLFVAAQLADLLWPALVAAGVEHVRIAPGITLVTPLDFVSYPYSHSLLWLAIWGALLGGVARRAGGGSRREWAVLAALVVSHWVLDWITHRPDMPLYPGGPTLGLGLWNSRAGTLAVELPLFAAGLWVYARATRARNRAGTWSFWGLAGFLGGVYLANIWGPPPPSVAAVYVLGLVGGALLILWSWRVDRQREVVVT